MKSSWSGISASTSFASSESDSPAKGARLRRDDIRQPRLHDVHLGPDNDFLQRDGHHHLARQVRVVEPIRPANPFVWNELQVFTAEGVAFADVKFVNDIL